MNVDTLIAAGFSVAGGQIDRNGKNYGTLTPSGVVWTAEGEVLAKALVEPAEPKRRRRSADVQDTEQE